MEETKEKEKAKEKAKPKAKHHLEQLKRVPVKNWECRSVFIYQKMNHVGGGTFG